MKPPHRELAAFLIYPGWLMMNHGWCRDWMMVQMMTVDGWKGVIIMMSLIRVNQEITKRRYVFELYVSCVKLFWVCFFQTGCIIFAFFFNARGSLQDLSNAVWALTKLGIQNAILYNLLADRILFLGSLNRNMLRKSLGDVPPMESWMKS